MLRKNLKTITTLMTFVSLFLSVSGVFAAPVRIGQVQQIVSARLEKAKTGGFARLRLNEDKTTVAADDDDSKSEDPTQKDDDRVIVETRSEIVEDDACDCAQIPVSKRGFPKWTLLGLGAIPAGFLIARSFREKDVEPIPTPSIVVTPTPPDTSTPTPTDPIPEPMTILLFGSGLAGMGIAIRRRLAKGEK